MKTTATLDMCQLLGRMADQLIRDVDMAYSGAQCKQNLRFDEVHAMLQKAKAHAQMLSSVAQSCTFLEEE